VIPIVLFDCEWLTDEGAWQRSNCGLFDPDPQIVQIGALKLDLDNDLKIIKTFDQLVQPVARDGTPHKIPKFFSDFTGISQQDINMRGKDLKTVIQDFVLFSEGCTAFWSWGKDELSLAKSCYLSKISFPINAEHFGNLSKIFWKSGMSLTDIYTTNSGRLAQHFGLTLENHTEHNALCDVTSIHAALSHLLEIGKLNIGWLQRPLSA